MQKKQKEILCDNDMKKIKELVLLLKNQEEDEYNNNKIEEMISDNLYIIEFDDEYANCINDNDEEYLDLLKESFNRTKEFIKNEVKILQEQLCNYDKEIKEFTLKSEYKEELKTKFINKKKNKKKYR